LRNDALAVEAFLDNWTPREFFVEWTTIFMRGVRANASRDRNGCGANGTRRRHVADEAERTGAPPNFHELKILVARAPANLDAAVARMT
jgi:hypothetical protein